MLALIIISTIIVALICMIIAIYNGLIRMQNQVTNALAQIDVQLKRRHDLIPNLVETVKGYMSHESATLEAVIAARNQARDIMAKSDHAGSDADHLGLLAKAETMLSRALGNFYAVAENYPELKADNSVKALFDEITNTENRIGFARQHYNDSVMFYNTRREVFPNNLVSNWFSFTPRSMLEFADKSAIDVAPKVAL